MNCCLCINYHKLPKPVITAVAEGKDFTENYDVYIDKRYNFSLISSAPRLCFSHLYVKLCITKMAVSTTKQVKIPLANTCNYTSFIM